LKIEVEIDKQTHTYEGSCTSTNLVASLFIIL